MTGFASKQTSYTVRTIHECSYSVGCAFSFFGHHDLSFC